MSRPITCHKEGNNTIHRYWQHTDYKNGSSKAPLSERIRRTSAVFVGSNHWRSFLYKSSTQLLNGRISISLTWKNSFSCPSLPHTNSALLGCKILDSCGQNAHPLLSWHIGFSKMMHVWTASWRECLLKYSSAKKCCFSVPSLGRAEKERWYQKVSLKPTQAAFISVVDWSGYSNSAPLLLEL